MISPRVLRFGRTQQHYRNSHRKAWRRLTGGSGAAGRQDLDLLGAAGPQSRGACRGRGAGGDEIVDHGDASRALTRGEGSPQVGPPFLGPQARLIEPLACPLEERAHREPQASTERRREDTGVIQFPASCSPWACRGPR